MERGQGSGHRGGCDRTPPLQGKCTASQVGDCPPREPAESPKIRTLGFQTTSPVPGDVHGSPSQLMLWAEPSFLCSRGLCAGQAQEKPAPTRADAQALVAYEPSIGGLFACVCVCVCVCAVCGVCDGRGQGSLWTGVVGEPSKCVRTCWRSPNRRMGRELFELLSGKPTQITLGNQMQGGEYWLVGN